LGSNEPTQRHVGALHGSLNELHGARDAYLLVDEEGFDGKVVSIPGSKDGKFKTGCAVFSSGAGNDDSMPGTVESSQTFYRSIENVGAQPKAAHLIAPAFSSWPSAGLAFSPPSSSLRLFWLSSSPSRIPPTSNR
jgi:hypothetical protein